MLQKLLGVIVCLLVVVWIVTTPVAAGNDVHGWVSGILEFFTHLSSG